MTIPKCIWTQDEDGNWDTGCQEKHILLEGGPYENRMRFCCYCVLPLKEGTPERRHLSEVNE